MTSRYRAWQLPLVFLLGYLLAWGMILVDRQMVISSQAELARELASTKKQLQLRALMEEFDYDWKQMVIWNKEAIKPQEGEKQ